MHLEPVISDVVGMEPISEGAIHHSIRASWLAKRGVLKKIDQLEYTERQKIPSKLISIALLVAR